VASTYTLKQRLALAVVPRVASMAIRCLCTTLKYEDVSEPGGTPGDHMPPPAIFAFWHRSLLACVWRFRNLGVAILISRSFDGELIARTVERLGFIAVRGSSSRDGSLGLRGLHRTYLAGHLCAITANLADSTIVAFYAHPERAWQLRSWDRFLIPKPFSRVTVAWSRQIPADLSAVQSALDRSVMLAEASKK
jgi:lysophospholipid acyltransferase (LPLAT)-like uncharacterized protein